MRNKIVTLNESINNDKKFAKYSYYSGYGYGFDYVSVGYIEVFGLYEYQYQSIGYDCGNEIGYSIIKNNFGDFTNIEYYII